MRCLTLKWLQAPRNQWMMVCLYRKLALWIELEYHQVSDFDHIHGVNLVRMFCRSIADLDWAKYQFVDLTCPTKREFPIDLTFHHQQFVLHEDWSEKWDCWSLFKERCKGKEHLPSCIRASNASVKLSVK